ncbi:hypothetical protein IscW_ISCW011934, partial [Ixodes scapularis]
TRQYYPPPPSPPRRIPGASGAPPTAVGEDARVNKPAAAGMRGRVGERGDRATPSVGGRSDTKGKSPATDAGVTRMRFVLSAVT